MMGTPASDQLANVAILSGCVLVGHYLPLAVGMVAVIVLVAGLELWCRRSR